MKDMLRDMMQDHAISVIIVIWRTLQNHSSVNEHGSFFILLRLDIREFKNLLRQRQRQRRLKNEFIFYLRISGYS